MFTPINGYQRAVVSADHTGGTPRIPSAPARYTVHVTVGRRLFDYPWPPQFTVGWAGGHSLPAGRYNLAAVYDHVTGPTQVDLDGREVLRLQHCDVTKTGYALLGKNPPRTLCETNHMGSHNLQCEFILPATNDPRYLHDWEYEIIGREIAAQIQGLRDAAGDQTLIDPTNIRDWHGSAAYGFNDPYEMSCAEWQAFNGVCGHVDIPGQNHWDPGNWDHKLLSSIVVDALRGGEAGGGGLSKPSAELLRYMERIGVSRGANFVGYWSGVPAGDPEWAYFNRDLQGMLLAVLVKDGLINIPLEELLTMDLFDPRWRKVYDALNANVPTIT
jgi:hypothetical protein